MQKANTVARTKAFFKALADTYGEGTVIDREQIWSVFNSRGLVEFPHPVVITKNLDYRVSRGMYLATTSSEPAKLRDQTVNNMQKLKAKKEETMLKQDVRMSPSKLAKEILDMDVGSNMNEDEDINELLKTISG